MIFPCPFFSFNAKRKQRAVPPARASFLFCCFKKSVINQKSKAPRVLIEERPQNTGETLFIFFLNGSPPPCRSPRAGREGRGRNRKQVKQKEGYHRKGKGKCGVNNRGGEKRSLSTIKFVLSFSLSLSPEGVFRGRAPALRVSLTLFPQRFFLRKEIESAVSLGCYVCKIGSLRRFVSCGFRFGEMFI